MTEVLPLPAAATTRLRLSSTTTALRCSSVSGRASIRSNRSRDRTSSFATNASFAFDLALSGASRNSRMPRSIRISGASDRESGQRATRPPAAACASRMSSPRASVSTYLGGSTSSASRSWTERSTPICGASAPRHHSTLALSTASVSALASVRERPDTVAAPVAWLSLTPVQRRPAFISTASMSRKAIFAERALKASSTLSAFTDAALASSTRSTANSGDASPVRFTPSVNPGSGACREELRIFSPRTLRHFSRPSGRLHKQPQRPAACRFRPNGLRPVAFAAPCRRIHRKTPDVSHGIGHFSEFYASGPARPLRCRAQGLEEVALGLLENLVVRTDGPDSVGSGPLGSDRFRRPI